MQHLTKASCFNQITRLRARSATMKPLSYHLPPALVQRRPVQQIARDGYTATGWRQIGRLKHSRYGTLSPLCPSKSLLGVIVDWFLSANLIIWIPIASDFGRRGLVLMRSPR